jgi:citrate lyase subunit beta / citryl-CoA lyase
MDLLRSLLLVSVRDTDALAAARRTNADAVILDLPGSGTPSDAEQIRAAAHEAAAPLHEAGQRVWVRVHPTGALLAKADIRATLSEHVTGYLLPHAQSQNHVRYTEGLLRDAEAAAGLKEGTARLIAVIESAEGLLNAREIARSTPRLAALALDGAGFCADMGVSRTREGHELQYARSHLAVCARAAGLPAIDTPFPFSLETQMLLSETVSARALGLHGKFAVTPQQVTAINAVFSPTGDEVAYARRLLAAHEAVAEEEAVAHIDGRLIDAPTVRRAKRLVDLATAIEAKEQQAAI